MAREYPGDKEHLEFELTRELLQDAPTDRLTQNQDLETVGRYKPVSTDREGTLSKHKSDMAFVSECLSFAMDRALYADVSTRSGKDKQFIACLLDKCARIAARELLRLS